MIPPSLQAAPCRSPSPPRCCSRSQSWSGCRGSGQGCPAQQTQALGPQGRQLQAGGHVLLQGQLQVLALGIQALTCPVVQQAARSTLTLQVGHGEAHAAVVTRRQPLWSGRGTGGSEPGPKQPTRGARPGEVTRVYSNDRTALLS